MDPADDFSDLGGHSVNGKAEEGPTSDSDTDDGPTLVLSPRSRPHKKAAQAEGIELQPLRSVDMMGVTRNSLNEVASAVKASFSEGAKMPSTTKASFSEGTNHSSATKASVSEGAKTPGVEHVSVTPQEHKKRNVEEMMLVDYLFCVSDITWVRP